MLDRMTIKPGLASARTETDRQDILRVSVRGVSKRFGTKRGEVVALDNVHLDVAENERVVLLGPSGCGKTTLLRCIAGLEIPDEGEIEIGGKVVYSSSRKIFVPPELRNISMMFQSYALWPHMTVARNIAFPLESQGADKSTIAKRVESVLALVECKGLEGRYPAQLSGGQQQRIALARAIVANDSVILFDEPLSNVDAKVREQLRVELVALQRTLRFSALYVTHDQTEATAVADRIAIFQSGRLAQVGTPRQIYNSPASSYVAEFIGSTNTIAGTVAATDGEFCEVDTDLGRVRGRNNDNLALNAPARILIRPEHIAIDSHAAKAGGNAFEAAVEAEMFLGHLTEHSVIVNKHRIVLRSNTREEFVEGEQVRVSFDADHVQIYRNA